MSKSVLMCRVSTEAQDYDAQIRDLKQYAKSKGITECKVIATKESGFRNIEEREGWIKTKEFFEEHADYDTLIVTEISRLGRRETAIAEIKEYMEKNKKSLFIKDLDLHLYDKGKKKPESDIVFSVFASMATSEMSVKKDRFMRSRKQLNEQGYSIVGKVLFGYKRVKDELKGKNKFIVDEKQAGEINELYNIYLYGLEGRDIGIKGLVLYAITRGMSHYLHSKRNMTKMLSERAYVGGIKEVKTKRKNLEYWKYKDHSKPPYIETISNIPYPKIVDKNLFDAVQKKKLDNRIIVDKSVKHETILSKLIECPKCHTFLIGDYRRSRKCASYRCSKHKGIGKCSNSSMISMSFLDSLVWCYLKENVKQIMEDIYKKNNTGKISDIDSEIFNCQKRKKELQEDVKTQGIIFKNEVRVLGIEKAQQKYDVAISEIKKQIDEIDELIDNKKRKIDNIKRMSSTSITDKDMERVEQDKKEISKYIHLLVNRILYYRFNKYTFVRIILNGDDDRTFRVIFARKEDNNKVLVFGFKNEKNMPFEIRNKENKTEENEIEWIESGLEVLEKMIIRGLYYNNDHSKSSNIDNISPEIVNNNLFDKRQVFSEFLETISHIPYSEIVYKNLFDEFQKKKLDNRNIVDKSVKHEKELNLDMELYPIEYKELQVYDDDLK